MTWLRPEPKQHVTACNNNIGKASLCQPKTGNKCNIAFLKVSQVNDISIFDIISLHKVFQTPVRSAIISRSNIIIHLRSIYQQHVANSISGYNIAWLF